MSDRPRRGVVYAMQVTDVLDFETYFEEYPRSRGRVDWAGDLWRSRMAW